jgi:integrase/recombinase XerD
MPVVIAYRKASTQSAHAINRQVEILSIMLNWAVGTKQISHNPIKGLKPLPHSVREGRALTDAEVKQLLDYCSEPFRSIYYAYLTTGMRRSELVSLTFDDVDFENREIVIRAEVSKNHRERRVPMDNELFNVVKRNYTERFGRRSNQPPDRKHPISHDHVFVSNTGAKLELTTIYKAFVRHCKRAGIDIADSGEGHIDLHSTRRTFATNLITNGADPKSVQELLGHATLTMTMKLYAKIRGTTKRAAVAKLSYGSGAESPAHVLSLVQKCHEFPTTEAAKAATA